MKLAWSFLLNVFLSVTRKSFKRMLSIATHHYAALDSKKGDPFFKKLFDRFKPIYEDFLQKYNNWTVAQGLSMGETSRFSEYFDEFVEKLLGWDVKIQNFFLKNTSDYKTIFPKGKSVFYHGTFEQRIDQLLALSERLGDYTVLDSLQTEIFDYYTLVHTELINHQNKQTSIKTSSKELEIARIEVGQMMYGNLGLLMDNFRINTDLISSYFPLDLIRQKKKNKQNTINNVYTLLLIAKEIKEAGISFNASTNFLIFNNGNAEIGIYTTGSKDDPPPVNPKFKLQPNEEKECTLADFGETDNRYMFVVNLDDNEEAEVEISIL